jgi:hypothetical protein
VSEHRDAVIHLDSETLLPVGVSTPCPSTTFASLGYGGRRGPRGFAGLTGVLVPCGNLADHDGPHVFHVEWTDPDRADEEGGACQLNDECIAGASHDGECRFPSWHPAPADHATENAAACPVPECSNGYVRVPLVVERINYGSTEKFVRFDDFQCDECGGLGRVPTRVIPPGKWDEDADALLIDKAREATREQDQP